MDWKNKIRPTLTWADGYEDAEAYDEDRWEDDDETVQDLNATHELWMALLKSWAGAHQPLETADYSEA